MSSLESFSLWNTYSSVTESNASLSNLKRENKHHTLVILELQVIFIISNHWVSSCEWNVFIVWSGNTGEINSGEGLDVKGVGVVIHYGKVHGADSKVGGPKWYLCVNHGNFWNGKKHSYEGGPRGQSNPLKIRRKGTERMFGNVISSGEENITTFLVLPNLFY